jgi:hypothetical protein
MPTIKRKQFLLGSHMAMDLWVSKGYGLLTKSRNVGVYMVCIRAGKVGYSTRAQMIYSDAQSASIRPV